MNLHAVVAVVALAGLPVLAYQSVQRDAPAVQADAQLTLQATLHAAELPAIVVEVDGRDVVLRGSVSLDVHRVLAGSLALASPGVRSVDNRIEVPPAAPPLPERPPGPTASELQTQLSTLLEAQRIEFEPEKATFKPVSLPVLESVLTLLQQAPHLKVRVEGHTDNYGDEGFNRQMSGTRAQATAKWLISRGVAADRLDAVGFGPDRPLVPNTTSAGRARNRRVEFIVHE